LASRLTSAVTIDLDGRTGAADRATDRAHQDMVAAENARSDQFFRWNMQLIALMDERANITFPLTSSQDVIGLGTLAQQKCATPMAALDGYECLSANSILIGTLRAQLRELNEQQKIRPSDEVKKAIEFQTQTLNVRQQYFEQLLKARADYFNKSLFASVDERVAKKKLELECRQKIRSINVLKKASEQAKSQFQLAQNFKAIRDLKTLVAAAVKVVPVLKSRCDASHAKLLSTAEGDLITAQSLLTSIDENLWTSSACAKAKNISELAEACQRGKFSDATLAVLWQIASSKKTGRAQ